MVPIEVSQLQAMAPEVCLRSSAQGGDKWWQKVSPYYGGTNVIQCYFENLWWNYGEHMGQYRKMLVLKSII